MGREIEGTLCCNRVAKTWGGMGEALGVHPHAWEADSVVALRLLGIIAFWFFEPGVEGGRLGDFLW